LVAQRKLACWKTEGPSESGEGYFFARADLEAVRRPAVEGVARAFPEGASCPRRPRNRAASGSTPVESLILCSDGITEVLDTEGKEHDEERLICSLHAHAERDASYGRRCFAATVP
jgi:hypothetical protein